MFANILSFCVIILHFAKAEIYDDYECFQPLMQRAVVTATSSLRDREPKNAILYGGNAWTAHNNDFEQKLIFDLGQVTNVTRVWTQGRTHSNEYVMEYSVSYGSNGYDYTDYKEPGGDTRLFKANTDGDSVHKNEFEVPIIAQWIRINPTRWRDRISLRVELFGCEYESDVMYFNSTAFIALDLLREPIAAYRESIRFRFKTSTANGILLYSRGTQGDYIAVQLRDNRMLLNIDLGSGISTSLSVGSLLDDNIWHDVVISRNYRDILFSVDRVVVQGRIKGEFTKLNLNREFYVGGVPNMQEGLIVPQNFTGCIENLYLNSTNLIRDMKDSFSSGRAIHYSVVNAVTGCLDVPLTSATFLTPDSYARLKGYEGVSSLNASFAFRTYEESGLMLYHAFSSSGHVAVYLEDGKIKVELITPNNPQINLDNFDETFNDGRWHTVVLTIGVNSMILSVDYRPMKTTRFLKMSTGGIYMIAGGVSGAIGVLGQKMPGFIGCMRSISIDGNYKLPTDWTSEEYCCKDQVVFDSCRMVDRCNPNPCEHGGVCKQNSLEFMCDCTGTGYAGSVCHTSLNALSCQAYKNVQAVNQKAEIKIDVDGSGPLAPFPVTCEFQSDGNVVTVLHHINQQTTTVDGFSEPGSFKQDIIYDADDDQIEALINRSSSCSQRIQYSCRSSRLLNSPSTIQDFNPFSWWVSRHNQRMDYWGGALPGSRKCECGILGTCIDPTKWCNCDAGYETWAEDVGDLTEKEYLPVKQLRFGDTGNALDEKEGRYTLGSLMCEGDDLFNNIVTFRVPDATIELPPFDMGHSGDIYFEFKTTVESAVIMHARGPSDYIKLSIESGNMIQFQYEAGSAPLTVNYKTSYRLADDRWHSVSVERNRKGARLVVDGALKSEVREDTGPVRALHLTSNLVIGATVDYKHGYTGCIRALLLNGQIADLRGYARRGLYGVGEDCIGRCTSNPCLNNGTCLERYDGFTCDCRWTAFKGPICADEIGVNLRQSNLVKYDFMGSWRSTLSEKIRVGFTTTNPKGFLLGFSSNISGEYMTIMVSNSGHLRIVFDFGFERQEIIYPEKHFGLGQYHDLRVSRKNSGATLVMQVDDYQPKEFHFDIKTSADAQFNNIQYMYIGKNESMSEGFIGCISRVEFDDIYPLKLLFQEQGPPNVRSIGTTLTEDFCGVEPITHLPPFAETRPPPIVDQDKLRKAYNQTDSAILGSILAIIFIALVVLAILIGRYLHRHKGEYLTQEDAGAESAIDPDSAVIQGTTGHQVQKKKEWFI
ncbi:hypothetical protein RN001_004206 [Aquatica leii]|uniref:Neurexin-4 n=1 Tax=Aquatica leii TaxID=1421715 RepID=A0AAN7PAC7_9COLE|nr:hypothetical protein RN001_004206 [Aquatica leii]